MAPIIYAHRGASKAAPENTMPAFELAAKQGADGIETDVQLTKDQIPVLIHDENVRRTTDGIGFVQDYTYKELQELDAGSWFSSTYSNTTIPTLDQLLAWNKKKKLKLNIELKNGVIDYEHIEKIVCERIQAHKMEKLSVISTFNFKSLKRLQKLNCAIPYSYLTSRRNPDLVQLAKELGVTGLHIRYRLLSKRLVEKAKTEKIYTAVYTVNHPFSIARVLRLGAHGLFTDIPSLAIQIRKKLTNP